MNNNLSYDEACETLRPIIERSRVKIVFPLQEEIDNEFINDKLSMLPIGDSNYTKAIKDALVVIFRNAANNTQVKKRSPPIDVSLIAALDENRHQYTDTIIDNPIQDKDTYGDIFTDPHTIPLPLEDDTKEIINHTDKETKKNIEMSFTQDKKDKRNNKKIKTIQKSAINKSYRTEIVEYNDIIKSTNQVDEDTTLSAKRSKTNLLPKTVLDFANLNIKDRDSAIKELKTCTDIYTQDVLARQIYGMIKVIYPERDKLRITFEQHYTIKDSKISGKLLKMALAPERSNTPIKLILSDISKLLKK